MRTPSNPFILTGYHSPDYFCDREEELAWLLDQYQNERNVVLYAWRRMGKTALIRHLFHHLTKSKSAECIFVDMLGTASLSEGSARIANAILRHSSESGSIQKKVLEFIGALGATVSLDPYTGMPQMTVGTSSSHSPHQSMEAIASYLKSLKKPVVIAIDEFQQVVDYPERNAEAVFRSWMQELPMVRFIYSGSHRHMMAAMFGDESRPFYRSAQMRLLEGLPREAYQSFVVEHFRQTRKQISDAQISQVFNWGRMQTYYLQLAFNKLYSKYKDVKDEHLSVVFEEILAQETPVFSTYQQLFTSFQWKVLIALAKSEGEESPMSQGFLSKYSLGAASSVGTALKALEKKEFVIREGEAYHLQDTLLMRWMQRF